MINLLSFSFLPSKDFIFTDDNNLDKYLNDDDVVDEEGNHQSGDQGTTDIGKKWSPSGSQAQHL